MINISSLFFSALALVLSGALVSGSAALAATAGGPTDDGLNGDSHIAQAQSVASVDGPPDDGLNGDLYFAILG